MPPTCSSHAPRPAEEQAASRAPNVSSDANAPPASRISSRIEAPSRVMSRDTHALNTAFVPGFTIMASRAASQLVRRMQPWLSLRPIVSGLGVPWMP